ncbi:MAG: HD domain-containing protein [Prevotella sp.]|nr:HD domain-containing protein [Prevotella sp.]
MDYQAIIDKYYPEEEDGTLPSSALRRLLLKHSRQVADRCLLIAKNHPELHADETFLLEAAMLHDIGIGWCHAPSIFCEGSEPYIRHGLIGAELLRREGYERHARVCERHTGTGITRQQIERQQLPLPLADYIPETLEEQLVCYADKFYSKSRPDRVLTVEETARNLEKFGHEGVEKFLNWAKMFE